MGKPDETIALITERKILAQKRATPSRPSYSKGIGGIVNMTMGSLDD
jgi:hypothetical protein